MAACSDHDGGVEGVIGAKSRSEQGIMQGLKLASRGGDS